MDFQGNQLVVILRKAFPESLSDNSLTLTGAGCIKHGNKHCQQKTHVLNVPELKTHTFMFQTIEKTNL